MVSHIDSDHVAGMVDFAGELVTEQEDSKPLSYAVGTLWHNSFDDILGNDAEELRTAAVEVLGAPVDDRVADEVRAAGLAVVASVAEGRELREQAETLGWSVNEPFDGPVVLPEEGVRTITLGPLKLTVVCPHAPQLEEAPRRRGRSGCRSTPRRSPTPPRRRPAATTSPYNLSSIVVLAECDGKTMLLTGDARDDHVLAGLDEAGIAKDGKTHVDILKLPHHGSIRNIAPRVLRARHRRSLRHLGQRARRQPRDRDAGADRRRPPRRRLHDPPDQPRRHATTSRRASTRSSPPSRRRGRGYGIAVPRRGRRSSLRIDLLEAG